MIVPRRALCMMGASLVRRPWMETPRNRLYYHVHSRCANRICGLMFQGFMRISTFYSPTRNPYCAALNGTTDSRPWRTSAESAKLLLALISASVWGFAMAFPTLIFTRGFFGSVTTTVSTVAVPTAGEDQSGEGHRDRKSTRLNSSHANISYAVF